MYSFRSLVRRWRNWRSRRRAARSNKEISRRLRRLEKCNQQLNEAIDVISQRVRGLEEERAALERRWETAQRKYDEELDACRNQITVYEELVIPELTLHVKKQIERHKMDIAAQQVRRVGKPVEEII